MSIRSEIDELVKLGPFPTERDATEGQVELIERLLKSVKEPVTDLEAQALLECFGEDGCFGLGWFVLHLIETAPSALTADYSGRAGNDWVKLLEDRRK
jgi:hypothetical protein